MEEGLIQKTSAYTPFGAQTLVLARRCNALPPSHPSYYVKRYSAGLSAR